MFSFRNTVTEEEKGLAGDRRVLLISQYFPPEPTTIVQELAESLIDNGFQVTVLTGYPNYPYGRIYDGYRMKLWTKERVGKIDVIRLPLYCAHGRNGVARVLNLVTFAMSIVAIGPWVAPRVDAIHVYQLVTVGGAARWLSFLRKIPMTIEVQDLWPDTLSATGMVDAGPILKFVGWFSNRIYRRADKVRVISNGFRRTLVSRGVDKEKILVIPNWVDTDTYFPATAEKELAIQTGLDGKFNVVFAGAMGLAQNLEIAIDAAALLSSQESIQLVFIGDGAELENLRAKVTTSNLKNVIFLERKPASEMSRYYALSDVLMLHLRSTPLFEMTIPHKVYAYLACGKPVLAAIEGEAANVVLEAKAGVVCPSDDPVAMAEKIRQLFAMTPQEREVLGHAGLNTALTAYSRRTLTRQVGDMIRSAIEKY